MPTFLGKLLCWIGFHVSGRERTCALEDRVRRRYVWCKQTSCTRCGRRLTLRKTGTESKMPAIPFKNK